MKPMRQLHVIVSPPEPWIGDLLGRLNSEDGAEMKVEVVDLTHGEPDYPALVRAVFEADSVVTW